MANPDPISDEPTHVDLLVMARAVRRSVIDDDTEAVHRQVARLRTALVSHLRAEQVEVPSMRGTIDVVVRAGQQRLLELVDDVMLDIDTAGDGCNCLVRAVEIELALRRQARLESQVLDHRGRR